MNGHCEMQGVSPVMMCKPWKPGLLVVLVSGLCAVLLVGKGRLSAAGDDTHSHAAAEAVRIYPPGPLGDVVRLGEEIVARTVEHPLSKKYVGNSLNCTSCHLKNGTDPVAASFIGVATAYPAWSPREKRVITLEDRVLNCFMRSCNGKRPPLGSDVSIAVTTYITWLSQDQPLKMNPQRPAGPLAVPRLALEVTAADKAHGEVLYQDRCADCHGEQGQGSRKNPPVWGDRSYNQGAGLANPIQLASWLKVAMPLDETTLTDQEALDIAAFLNSHPRPAFRLADHLPPAAELGMYNGSVETD